jgi:hypothetical protein
MSISNTTLSELDKAVSDLHLAEAMQKKMKDSNAIIRSKKNVTERLIKEAGLTEASALKIQTPDFAGRIGFPAYSLTNNNANIKRLQDRVNMLEKKVEGSKAVATNGEEKYTFEGGEILVNYPEDRVQILFPGGGRVEKELFTTLRKNGWVFSPTNKAFQRKITPQAISNAVYLFKAERVGGPNLDIIEATELTDSEYEKMLENRNFSYVSGSLYGAIPEGYVGDKTFHLVYFNDLSPLSVSAKVKAYFSQNFPEVDAEKVRVSVYPKTYIIESKGLFKEGKYLPSNESPEKVLYPLYKKLKNFFAMEMDTRFDEPEVVKPIAKPTKMVKLLRDYNGVRAGEIGEVIKTPNMFVKEVKFGDKTFTIDNGYIEIVKEPTIEVVAPKVEVVSEEVINPNSDEVFDEIIMDNIEPHDDWVGNLIKERDVKNQIFKQLMGEEAEKKAETERIFQLYAKKHANGKQVHELHSKNTINTEVEDLHEMDLWKKLSDGRFYRKFNLQNDDKFREFTDNGIKERVEELKGNWVSVILSVRSEAEAERISTEFMETYPIDKPVQSKKQDSSTKIPVQYITLQIRDDRSEMPKYISNSFLEADKKMRFILDNERFSDLNYNIEFEDGETLGGIIDCEPRDFFDNVSNPFTRHINTFWGNVAKGKGAFIMPEDAEKVKEMMKKYDFGEDTKPVKETPKSDYQKELERQVAEGEIKDASQGISLYHLANKITNEPSFKLFKGVQHNYSNQYELNKAIEELLDQKGEASTNYTSDEKNFIRKYSGYGGLDKYGTTGKGGLFEYYTPKMIIEKMWALAYKFGYNNGSVLEPSVATGEFLQFAKEGTRIVGYEINKYSAMICKILYPLANIILQPFEQLFIRNNWTMKDNIDSLEKFDLVIGNPPYGDFSIVASRYMTGMGEKDHTKAKNYVEYFIRRGMDLLKKDGLLIFIVGAQLKNGGTLFLDSGPSPVKEYLNEQCDFLDAYRLPDSVFERTGVTSEIIVLKKK